MAVGEPARDAHPLDVILIGFGEDLTSEHLDELLVENRGECSRGLERIDRRELDVQGPDECPGLIRPVCEVGNHLPGVIGVGRHDDAVDLDGGHQLLERVATRLGAEIVGDGAERVHQTPGIGCVRHGRRRPSGTGLRYRHRAAATARGSRA